MKCVEEVNKVCKNGEQYIKAIVEEYTKELDMLIEEIKKELADENNLSNLHRFNIELPVLIYRLSSVVEQCGFKADIAELIKNDKYSQCILAYKGTIPEKEAQATRFSNNNAFVKEIYDRAYYTIKSKVSGAEQVLISIRGLINSLEVEKRYN